MAFGGNFLHNLNIGMQLRFVLSALEGSFHSFLNRTWKLKINNFSNTFDCDLVEIGSEKLFETFNKNIVLKFWQEDTLMNLKQKESFIQVETKYLPTFQNFIEMDRLSFGSFYSENWTKSGQTQV